MMKKLLTFVIAILAATTLAAMAQPEDVGKVEYMTYCANCHGDTGLGDGPLAGILTVEVPDLTKWTEKHDGDFPFLETLMIVDGRTGVRGHGGQMPFWGDRFSREAEATVGPYGSEVIARGRLLSLVYYLESIQE
jgi:mono/diheme cytochrome c family protein